MVKKSSIAKRKGYRWELICPICGACGNTDEHAAGDDCWNCKWGILETMDEFERGGQ